MFYAVYGRGYANWGHHPPPILFDLKASTRYILAQLTGGRIMDDVFVWGICQPVALGKPHLLIT